MSVKPKVQGLCAVCGKAVYGYSWWTKNPEKYADAQPLHDGDCMRRCYGFYEDDDGSKAQTQMDDSDGWDGVGAVARRSWDGRQTQMDGVDAMDGMDRHGLVSWRGAGGGGGRGRVRGRGC